MGEPEGMLPTLRLRWHVLKNTVTRVEVVAYGEQHGLSFSEAKNRLEQRTEPVLQQYWEGSDGGEWRPVEVVVEQHPQVSLANSASPLP